jgi:Flp pilus assembly protein TadG
MAQVRLGWKRRKGTASVELALTLPVLALLTIGTIDFGRLFFHGIAVASASHTGAFYGSQGNREAVDEAGMEAMVTSSAQDLLAVTATAEHYCDCPDAPAAGPDDSANVVACGPTVCANGYGVPRVFVRAKVQHTFQTVAKYPGIPVNPVINHNGYMRVQ